ncbi:hypothetical protein [Streptomyces incarnatus]|nr:hypothetical protein [Streptomyces incarnatus]
MEGRDEQDDAPVTLVRPGPVATAVSAVPREEFSKAALKTGL